MTDNKKYFTVAHAYRHSQAFHSHKKMHIDIMNSPKVMLSIKKKKNYFGQCLLVPFKVLL